MMGLFIRPNFFWMWIFNHFKNNEINWSVDLFSSREYFSSRRARWKSSWSFDHVGQSVGQFFQTRNVFENEIISKIKLQKTRTCAQVRVFSQRVRGRARAQHKKFSACACVRVRIFKKFRVRGRARSRAPVPAWACYLELWSGWYNSTGVT